MKRALIGILLLCPAVAQAGSYGTELPFVFGVGARATAMGLAGVSLTGTPSSQYFNPATLALQDYRALELYRTTFFEDETSYMAASYSHPTLDFGTIGVSVLRIGVGGIEERDESNLLLSSDLTSTAMRVLLGYAAGVTRTFALGANLKIDNQNIAGVSGTGVGVDIGALLTRDFSADGYLRSGRAGISLENVVEPSIQLDIDKVDDPMRITAGASVDGGSGRVGWTAAFDMVSPRYSPFRLRGGIELEYDHTAAIRVGFDDDTPTFGAGVGYRGVQVDYAFRDEELGTNHRFSVVVAFGASKAERIRERQGRADLEMHERVQQRIQQFEDDQLNQFIARADSLFVAGDFAAAEMEYSNVLAWDPSQRHSSDRKRACRFEIEVASGREQAEAGDLATALYHYRRAETLAPGNTSVAAQIAECERRVLEERDRAAAVETLFKRSIDLYARGRLPEAMAGFQEVLRIDPAHALARDYQRKIQVSIQSSVEQNIARARLRAQNGDVEGAVDLLEQAKTLAPSDPRLDAELAAIRKGDAAPAPAAPVARIPAPAFAPTVGDASLLPRYREGIRLLEQGRFDAAARELWVVWTAAPSFRDVATTAARAYLFAGMQAYAKGGYTDAIDAWERVLVIDPDNAKARRYLKNAREEASRLGAARP